jgi:phosphate transport system substrate-binding protein
LRDTVLAESGHAMFRQQGKPVSKHSDAARRGRACAVALALLLGFSSGAATEEFKIGGSGAALGTMRLLAAEFTATNPDIRVTTVPSLGSGGSIKAVLAGAIGLAVTSRPVNESERKLGAVEMEYARTPFVFAVSTKSRVTAITSGELADIYAGRIVAWADGSPVRIVLRPAGDIDTEMVRNISPAVRRGLAVAEARPGVQFSVNDQDAANDLERIPGSIGPSSLALIVSEKRALRALKLDGMEPTPMNAASGAYPYYKRLFLVSGAKRPAAVERFVAFVQSPAGRKILESNGQWIS